jgi:hypothetical protein
MSQDEEEADVDGKDTTLLFLRDKLFSNTSVCCAHMSFGRWILALRLFFGYSSFSPLETIIFKFCSIRYLNQVTQPFSPYWMANATILETNTQATKLQYTSFA